MSAIVAVPYDSAISKAPKAEESSLSVTVTLGSKKEAVVKNFRIRGLDLADLQLESLRQSVQQVLGVDYPLIIRNVSPDGTKYCLNKQDRLVRALAESEGSLTLLCRRKFGAKSKKQEETYVDWIAVDVDEEVDDEFSDDSTESEEAEKPRRRGRHHAHCHHYHEECRKQREHDEHAEQEPASPAEPQEDMPVPAAAEEKAKPRRAGRHHAHCHHYHEECRKQREQEEQGADASESSKDGMRAAWLQKREAKQELREMKRQQREQKRAFKEARKEEKKAEKAARKEMKEEKKAARAAAKQPSADVSATSSDEESGKPRERFAEHLKVLAGMGFDKERVNLRLLKRFDGDVTKVAQELVSKQLKKTGGEHKKPSSPRRHRRRSQDSA